MAKTLYYHDVLEAKIVTPNGFAFSVMSEFIENPAPNVSKQDFIVLSEGDLPSVHQELATLRRLAPEQTLLHGSAGYHSPRVSLDERHPL